MDDPLGWPKQAYHVADRSPLNRRGWFGQRVQCAAVLLGNVVALRVEG